MPAKKHEPTKEQRDTVTILAAAGLGQERISKHLKISVPTLEKHYRDELNDGATSITKQAVVTLVKAMQAGGKGAVGAAAFWLKCREGWEERSAHRFIGADGKDRPAFDIDAMRAYMQTVPDDQE